VDADCVSSKDSFLAGPASSAGSSCNDGAWLDMAGL